jgi:RNA polymerase sigma-70 factor (ECF subfamily)
LVHQPGEPSTADAALLHQFVEHHDEAAFAGLVDRHRSLVWGVCYRLLGHVADTEDAFQATFLVLARKARFVQRESLPGWLHGVAWRVASRVRRTDTARRQRENRATPQEAGIAPDEMTWKEVRQVLDEELARLPVNYRLPLLLCYLEGKTQDEAARELGWALGVFRGRLDRGREQLRHRLVRRGVGLPGALGAALLAESVSQAAMPADLAARTSQAVSLSASGQQAVSAPVATLVRGILRAMLLDKIQWVAALAMSAILLAVGAGVVSQQVAAQKESPAQPAAEDKASPPGDQNRPCRDSPARLARCTERLSGSPLLFIPRPNAFWLRPINSRTTGCD